jgi:hypothetical protein
VNVADANGLFGDALAAIEEAQLHNYSANAALWAAVDHLELADRDEAILIAGLLASWIVTHQDPSTRVTDLSGWLGQVTSIVARHGGGS